MKKNAQIAIEFMLLLAVAIIVIIVLLISFSSISKTNSKIDNYHEVDDLGQSLQQEFFLASELEDGYTRRINLPLTLSDDSYGSYSVAIVHSNKTYVNATYIVLVYGPNEVYYAIPYVNGTLSLGNNILVKNHNLLQIN